jgi:hypothetical protein
MKNQSNLDSKTFFIVKYWIIVNTQNLIFLAIIYFTGPINFLHAFPIAVLMILLSLLITRQFEKYINNIAFRACVRVSKSQFLKKIVTKYL